ncbi:YceD family protein, partial [Actinomyces naeslundii]
IGVPAGSDLVLDVTLTSMDDGVLAHADADLHVHGECVRCLRDLDEDRTVRIDELYLFPEAIEAQRAQGDEEADDLLALGDTTLDLEPALRDALVPTLPFQPLCRPDCPGLCPDCGRRLEDLPADHHHEVLDPRWSALAGLLETEPDPQGEAPEEGRS